MKKYLFFLMFSVCFINSAWASRYDSTLVSYCRFGEIDCQMYEYSERKFVIVTDIDSTILIQDSLYYWSFDSTFHNINRNVFSLDSSRNVLFKLEQNWDSSRWTNYQLTTYQNKYNRIIQKWSTLDSAWINYYKKIF